MEVIKRATSLAVLIRHGNKVRGRDAKWPQSGGGDAREYILERGGGNDLPPSTPSPLRAYVRGLIRGGEGERGSRENRARGKIRCLSLCDTRWNRNGSVTQLRRVSVYTPRRSGGR